jgi:glycosyltransferase involved in cell wall biosynthesis
MKLSIAMCTYNGGAYLYEQLESICAQTRLPDELVVCDDGSSDATREILQSFAARAAFPVRLFFNEHNLRSTKNFEQAIRRCDGDIIALSDQDDVWQTEKLERLEKAFLAKPQAGLVFTDAEVVDEHLRPLGHLLFPAFGFTPKRQKMVTSGKAFAVLLTQNIVTGATMAFRAHLRSLILPIPTAFPLIHDGWIALIIAAVTDLIFINQPLIKYRQHAHQQMGVRPEAFLKSVTVARKTGPSAYMNHVEQFERAYDHLLANRNLCRERVLPLLKAKIDHLSARAGMPVHRLSRIPVVLREVLNRRYFRYSRGLYSAARDLML